MNRTAEENAGLAGTRHGAAACRGSHGAGRCSRWKIPRMTRTEKIARARKVRRHLAQFTAYQKPHMREFIRKEWNRDPDYAALSQLVLAWDELGRLIQDLKESEPR